MDPKLIRVNFICPVCQGLAATQPVLAEDGFIYHDLCIKEYIDTKNHTLSSPMKGIIYGSTLITLKAFEPTIKILETCEEPIDGNNHQDEQIADTIMKARLGDLQHMATLGRWHYGHCLIRGLGTEKNKTEGYEALVDGHSEGSGDGKDFAAYTLGFCYKGGFHGFKIDEKKATRWLSKVVNKPNDLQIWGYKIDEDENPNESQQQDIPSNNINDAVGGKLLFGDKHSVSTETTYIGSLESMRVKCKVCCDNCDAKSLLGGVCRRCAEEDFSNSLSLMSALGLED